MTRLERPKITGAMAAWIPEITAPVIGILLSIVPVTRNRAHTRLMEIAETNMYRLGQVLLTARRLINLHYKAKVLDTTTCVGTNVQYQTR